MTYEMTGSRVPNLKLGFVREIRQGHPEQPWSPYEYEANARCREGMTSAPNARDADVLALLAHGRNAAVTPDVVLKAVHRDGSTTRSRIA